MSFRLDVRGIPEARRFLETQRQGALQLGAARLTVTSELPYARPIETGVRGGRMWRRAGPARMFARGAAEVGPTIPGRIAGAFRRGPGAVRSEIARVGSDLRDAVRRSTPARTGRLRESIRDVFR